MDLFALAIGICIAVLIIVLIRARRLESTDWAYPILLASFPVYYWIFALYVSDFTTLFYEFLAGLLFPAIAYLAYRFRSFTSLLLLAVGYAAHAGYDVYHGMLFGNAGVPDWWPEFCGSIDLVIGIYVACLAFRLRKQAAIA